MHRFAMAPQAGARSHRGAEEAWLLCAAMALAPWPSTAQTALQIFQSTIAARGIGCDAVAKAEPIGTGSNGDALVAVACSGGGQHVVRIRRDNSVSYMSSCADLKARTAIQCFARQ